MHDLFENSPQPIVTLRRDGQIASANAAARGLGLHVDRALGDVLEPITAKDLIDILRRVPAGGREERTLDVPTPDGPVTCQVVLQQREERPDAPYALFLRPQSDEETAGRLLRRMVAHTTGAGQTYFEQVVVHLASKLDTRWALIAVPQGAEFQMRTLACCHDGELVPSFEFSIEGGPCEDILKGQASVYPAGIQRLFPHLDRLPKWGIEALIGVPLIGRNGEGLGVIVLMHDQPMADSANAIGFLNLFAGRTSTEVERVMAQREAERQRALAERLLDRVGALVLLLDTDGRVLRANRTVTRVTGWSEEQLLGKRLWDTLAPEDASGDLYAMLRTTSGAIDQDWCTPRGDRRRVRWEAQGVSVGSESQSPYVLVTGMDLTTLEATRRERDQLQERLRQARRLEALGRLAGGVAHDFNNLLLAILGYADLIEFESPEGSEAAQFAGEIRRAGDQAASLTRQLLAFGRRQRLERRELDLCDVVEGAISILRPLLPDDVELQVDLPDATLPVVADPGRLEQVIVNLGVNARDAMPEGGTISLRAGVVAKKHPAARHPVDMVTLEVRDSGTGIPADVLPHIFEPFFTTKELGRGTGLGLASVYGTVQQHGGTLDVSTEEGEGTSFLITLPLATLARVDSPTTRAAISPALQGRVLVAEDDPHVRSLVIRVLTSAGYQVEARADGAEAWELWAKDPSRFDLVLADVLMPRMGGIELCEKLLERAPGTRIVLTSGFVAESDRVPEAVRLLQKPYLPDDLLHEVGKALTPDQTAQVQSV